MELQVKKEDLAVAFDVSNGCAAGQGAMVTAHIVFRPNTDGTYSLLATNQRNFCEVPLKVAGEGSDVGTFTIEAKRLAMWFQGVPDGADITISIENKKVVAKTAGGRAVFSSIDPSKFPYWDKALSEAKITGTIKASRLMALLTHARQFICDQDQRRPQICALQCRDGSMYSTDQIALSTLTSAPLANCGFRIHHKDVGNIIQFLRVVGDDDVEVLEHDKFTAFRRADGALAASTKLADDFPTLKVNKDAVDPQWWAVGREELIRAVDFVTASAEYDDTRLTVARNGDVIDLTMNSSLGDPTTVSVTLQNSEFNGKDGEEVTSFKVSNKHLKRVLTVLSGDHVKMGIQPKGRSGWIRFQEKQDGDDYQTLVTWLV